MIYWKVLLKLILSSYEENTFFSFFLFYLDEKDVGRNSGGDHFTIQKSQTIMLDTLIQFSVSIIPQ